MPVPKLSLTQQELEVVRLLQQSPIRSRKAIARECGISESVLSKLITRIEVEGGILRTNVIIFEPTKFGLNALAFFQVQCDYKTIDSVMHAVQCIRGVQEVHQLFGSMDILLLKVRGRTSDDLSNIQGKIRALEGVRMVRVDPAVSRKEEFVLPI